MFRFTIRDLLWLMVVVALALGWWVDHRSLWHKVLHANLKLLGIPTDRWAMRYALEREGYTIHEDGERWTVVPPVEANVNPDK